MNDVKNNFTHRPRVSRHNDQTIVTGAREKRYPTRKISILFTAKFTADRVRKINSHITKKAENNEHVPDKAK